MQGDIARHLEKDVANEEDTGRKTKLGRRSARSSSIPLGAANPIAVRSKKLMKNINATNGTSRVATFLIALCSTGTLAAALLMVTPSKDGRGQAAYHRRVPPHGRPQPRKRLLVIDHTSPRTAGTLQPP